MPHLVDTFCFTTVSVFQPFHSGSAFFPAKEKIVCPKLRVSPLNAQTEFKVFTMQTVSDLLGLSTADFLGVRGSDSYCFPCFPPTLWTGSCLPPSLAIQVGVPSCVSLAQPFGHSMLYQCLQFPCQRLVFTISVIISFKNLWDDRIQTQVASARTSLAFVTLFAFLSPTSNIIIGCVAPNLSFFQASQPVWNAHILLPFRVTPQSRHCRGDQVIYACYRFRTLRPFRCFHRGNTHQFGVTFSPKDSFQEILKILLRVYPGMRLDSASCCPLIS
jgi:hypothetical protein